MARDSGKLWEARLRDAKTPVWLLEWAIQRQARRRVMVAVDTTDSCAEHRARLGEFCRLLANTLEVSDRCSVWILGRAVKAVEMELDRPQQRQHMAYSLAAAIVDERGGTWISETVNAMVKESANVNAGENCFLLVVSDGEIFDAESLPSRSEPAVGFVRLGNRTSRQLGVMKSKTTEVSASEPGLKKFLASPPMSVRLKHDWKGDGAAYFSSEGDLLDPLPPGDLCEVPTDQGMLRVAFVGGTLSSLSLRYSGAVSSWTDDEVARHKLTQESEKHLLKVVRQIQGDSVDWNKDLLRSLVVDQERNPSVRCSGCGHSNLLRSSLFCTVCEALLVSRDGIKRRDLPLLGAVRFPVSNDGAIGESSHCDWSPGDHAYGVSERDGGRWLALKLF